MKLKNPLITDKLRIFYFENKWKHKEVQRYLSDHYNISVGIRTLKYWKKKLKDPQWKHPLLCKPPIPPNVIRKQNINRIIELRKKTGWGALTLDLINQNGRGAKTYELTQKSI